MHDINVDESGNLYGVDNSYESSTRRFISALWKMTPSGEFSYILAPTHVLPKAMKIWKDRAGNRYYVGQRDNSGGEIFVLKRAPDGIVTTIAGNRRAGDAYRQTILYSIGGMAIGADDALFFTANNNIQKVTVDGRLTMVASALAIKNAAGTPVPEGEGIRLFGIAVDKKDSVFVADHGSRHVLKIEAGPRQIGKSGEKLKEQTGRSVIQPGISTVMRTEEPWSPTGVASKDDNIYVLESGFAPPTSYATRVRKLGPDGRITVLASVGENVAPVRSENIPDPEPKSADNSRSRMAYFLAAVVLGIAGAGGVLWWVSRRTSIPR